MWNATNIGRNHTAAQATTAKEVDNKTHERYLSMECEMYGRHTHTGHSHPEQFTRAENKLFFSPSLLLISAVRNAWQSWYYSSSSISAMVFAPKFIVICLRFYGFTLCSGRSLLTKFRAPACRDSSPHTRTTSSPNREQYFFFMKMNELSRFCFMSCAKI